MSWSRDAGSASTPSALENPGSGKIMEFYQRNLDVDCIAVVTSCFAMTPRSETRDWWNDIRNFVQWRIQDSDWELGSQNVDKMQSWLVFAKKRAQEEATHKIVSETTLCA